MRFYSTVYTHLENKHSNPIEMLNIIHIHLDDSSDDVSIEVAYMTNEQSIIDF